MGSKFSSICLKLDHFAPELQEFNELKQICDNNNITFQIHEVKPVPKASLGEFLYTIFFSPEMINAITSGIISAAIYEIIKGKIIKIIIKAKQEKITYSKVNHIELRANGANLNIQSNNLTHENIDKAIDTFVNVANNFTGEAPVKPQYIVVTDDSVQIMSQYDFVMKYEIKKMEEPTNDQPKNAHPQQS